MNDNKQPMPPAVPGTARMLDTLKKGAQAKPVEHTKPVKGVPK